MRTDENEVDQPNEEEEEVVEEIIADKKHQQLHKYANDLWSASKYGNIDQAKYHLLKEDDSKVNRIRWSGVTALHRAVENNHLDVVQYLVQNGADLNARTTWGWYSPLHQACKRGYEDIARYLLLSGAKWGVPDKAKMTPLKHAIKAGFHEMAERLDSYARELKHQHS